LAAQQHELTLTRHYEALLLARETKTMPADPTTATNISASFQRLSQHLRGLLRALSGEEPDPLAGINDQNENNASIDLETFKSLLQGLEHEDTGTDDSVFGLVQDWAHVRECEISRLEKENQELRRILDIDQKSVDEHGIVVDADAYPKISQRTSRSRSGSNIGGGESWGTRPLSQTGGFTVGPAGGAEGQVLNSFGGGSGNVNNGQQHQQPQHQQPQQHILQRPMDVGPGMRMQGRRPAMFGTGGQRGGSTIGRGGGGGGSSLWNSPPGPPTSAWQAQGTSSLDLSR
jgi:hypothetical protein